MWQAEKKTVGATVTGRRARKLARKRRRLETKLEGKKTTKVGASVEVAVAPGEAATELVTAAVTARRSQAEPGVGAGVGAAGKARAMETMRWARKREAGAARQVAVLAVAVEALAMIPGSSPREWPRQLRRPVATWAVRPLVRRPLRQDSLATQWVGVGVARRRWRRRVGSPEWSGARRSEATERREGRRTSGSGDGRAGWR